MVEPLSGIQAVAVLYDLALTIGGEVALPDLLTKTLQRLLYHTGFPAGVVLSGVRPAGEGQVEADLEVAIGNYTLLKRQGKRLQLPAALLEPTPAYVDSAELLAPLESRRKFTYGLRLPVGGFGFILLLAGRRPARLLPMTELFMPVMGRLATAISVSQRLSERTAALELANRELEAFAYSVSHDLRAPLRAIDGFSHILLEDYADKLDDEGKRLLALVRGSAERMGQLIEDLLNFSRAGRQAMASTTIDMAALARDVFDELRQTNPARTLRLELRDPPAMRGDRALMRQVLVNLLANAVKFTAPRPEAVIEFGGSVGAGEISYYVKDNGVGFDMQYVDKLFGVFQRLHAATEFEGTGIGLAIVKRIITRHGGRIWAEGRVGEGATFSFTVAAQAPAAMEDV